MEREPPPKMRLMGPDTKGPQKRDTPQSEKGEFGKWDKPPINSPRKEIKIKSGQ